MRYQKKECTFVCCKHCGTSFRQITHHHKYCSEKCAKEHQSEQYYKNNNKEKIEYKKVCPVCKKEFVTIIKSQYFCSEVCNRATRKSLNLVLPLVREYFLERANFKCEECGVFNNVELQLHHIIPIYKGGFDKENNIVVLCKQCHLKKHKIL